jgi:hypothetical protein
MSKIYVDEIHPKTSGGDITVNRKLYNWFANRTAGDVGVNTDIVFNNVIADPDSVYNSSTGIVTIPVTGLYQINFQCITEGLGSQYTVGLFDASNNRYHLIGTHASGDWYENLSCSFAIPLNQGDTLKLRVTGGTIYASGGNGSPNFSGFLVG